MWFPRWCQSVRSVSWCVRNCRRAARAERFPPPPWRTTWLDSRANSPPASSNQRRRYRKLCTTPSLPLSLRTGGEVSCWKLTLKIYMKRMQCYRSLYKAISVQFSRTWISKNVKRFNTRPLGSYFEMNSFLRVRKWYFVFNFGLRLCSFQRLSFLPLELRYGWICLCSLKTNDISIP